MLQMNLITQKELWGEVRHELYWELYWKVSGELYWHVSGRVRWDLVGPLGSQILIDFSHSKISRV